MVNIMDNLKVFHVSAVEETFPSQAEWDVDLVQLTDDQGLRGHVFNVVKWAM